MIQYNRLLMFVRENKIVKFCHRVEHSANIMEICGLRFWVTPGSFL